MDSNGWADIAYSSLVCPHGVRFEGRGPGRRTAAQGTAEGNHRSYAVCYIAGANDPLTDAAKAAFLAEGDRLAPLRWGHQDWKSTACPGTDLWAWRQAGFPGSTSQEEDGMSKDDALAALAEFFEASDGKALLRRQVRRGVGDALGEDRAAVALVDAVKDAFNAGDPKNLLRTQARRGAEDACGEQLAGIERALAEVRQALDEREPSP